MPVYVQHESLGKVGDVFDADAIWHAGGLSLFSRRPLLRDLLERSPREHRGRAATRCFSHVTLMLPQDDVDDDRHLTRGARVRDLADTLASLHQKDFGDLLGGDEVRYRIVGTEALEPGQVQVKFGHAVYLPAPGEQVLYTVSASTDSAIWHPVCAVYPNQRLTVLGQDAHEATCAVPNWPFETQCTILVINDGPDALPEVQVRPKDAFECRFDAASGYHTIRPRASGERAPQVRLLLKLARQIHVTPPSAQAAPQRAPAVWKSRSTAPEAAAAPVAPEADLTAVPVNQSAAPEADLTYAPVARQRVSLAAIALPRLSRYRETGALGLELGLSRSLAPGVHGKDSVLSFAVDGADTVHAVTAAGRQRIELPASFSPLEGSAVRVLPAEDGLAERYCALVCAASGPALPVPTGVRFVFGRGAPMLAGLRVLDAPGALRLAGGSQAASADRLGLSRKAFGYEAVADGVRIERLSPTQALYHLDGDLRFVAAIEEASQERPYLVPHGHHLVAGHYVLRFDA